MTLTIKPRYKCQFELLSGSGVYFLSSYPLMLGRCPTKRFVKSALVIIENTFSHIYTKCCHKVPYSQFSESCLLSPRCSLSSIQIFRLSIWKTIKTSAINLWCNCSTATTLKVHLYNQKFTLIGAWFLRLMFSKFFFDCVPL